MIQRIQSAYLLISLILVAILFAFPLIDFVGNDGVIYFLDFAGFYKVASSGNELLYSGWPVASLIGIICVLHLAILFLYKKRILQMRMTVFSIMLLLGYFGLSFYLATKYAGLIEGSYSFKVSFIFPLIAIILDYLAIRAIGKDEALIRSIDRIR
ncbi:DUF4293 family protein [Puteibacter caeruleilacunae]|nr:DUF4293 family protein [Puteibacter caeruleilacunae]